MPPVDQQQCGDDSHQQRRASDSASGEAPAHVEVDCQLTLILVPLLTANHDVLVGGERGIGGLEAQPRVETVAVSHDVSAACGH